MKKYLYHVTNEEDARLRDWVEILRLVGVGLLGGFQAMALHDHLFIWAGIAWSLIFVGCIVLPYFDCQPEWR